jgi:molecular chaperone GrpE
LKQNNSMSKKTAENKPHAVAQAPAAAPNPAEVLAPVTQPPLTAEQIEDLKDRAAKADENWERLLRTAADFENFKKRAARERHEAVKFANEALIQKLIPVLDSFDMALASPKNPTDEGMKSLHAGITLIYQQLRAALKNAGLEEVDATGKPFDPTVHEAVAQRETSEVAADYVLQQIRKGYKLHGRLLRPASAVVAKAPTTSKPDAPEQPKQVAATVDSKAQAKPTSERKPVK